MTPEQYLEWEGRQEGKNEYHNGVIVARADVTLAHDQITINIMVHIGAELAHGCHKNTAAMRIGVPACNSYYYADMSVTCGEQRFRPLKDNYTLLNPTLIVEVLSPSTERVDRDDKLRCYRTLDSLATYVLVSQHTPRIEIYTAPSRQFVAIRRH